jgi:hypothetical protein
VLRVFNPPLDPDSSSAAYSVVELGSGRIVMEVTMSRLLTCLALLIAITVPAFAHHSFSMFSIDKNIVLTGQVKEFQWTNPHVWIQLSVPMPDGTAVEWSIEGNSPNVLSRQGWTKRSVKVGDKITVTAHPLRDGTPGASMVKALLADGKVVGGE